MKIFSFKLRTYDALSMSYYIMIWNATLFPNSKLMTCKVFIISTKMICKKNLNFQIQNNSHQRGFDLFICSVSSVDVALVWNNKSMAFKVNCFVFTNLRSFGSGMHQTVPYTCKYASIFLTYLLSDQRRISMS